MSKRPEKKKRRTPGVRVVRSLGLLLLVLVTLLLCIGHLGLPHWLQDYILSNLAAGPYAFEASSVRLSPVDGIVLSDVALYKKRVVGPPAVQAEQAVVHVDVWALLARRPPLRSVDLTTGALRPDMLVVRGPDDGVPYAGTDYGAGIEFALSVRDFAFEGLVVEGFRGRVRGNGSVLEIDDVSAEITGSGRRASLRGSVTFESREALLEGDLEVVGDPHAFRAAVEKRDLSTIGKLMRRFAFGGAPPRWTFSFRRVCRPRSPFFLEGDVTMRDCRYRDVSLLRVDSNVLMDFSGTNMTVRLDQLMLVRPEGLVTGGFTMSGDATRRDVTFDVTSSIHPCAASRMVGVLTNQLCGELTFSPPFRVEAKGRVDLMHKVGTDFDSHWECGAVEARSLTVENATFDVGMQGLTCRMRDLHGSLCEGAVTGRVDFILAGVNPGPVHYDVELRLEDADFEAFMATRGLEDRDFMGALSGRLSLSGLTGEQAADALSGTGSLRIKDGRIFMLPVFGGLSDYMARAIPGMEFVLRQGDARTKFIIADRKIRSDRILIEGGVLSFTGSGAYHFDRRLDFDAELTLFKSHTFMGKFIRIPTYLISKLFEFRLAGTLDEPKWYPVNFSRDVLQKLGLKGADREVEPLADEGARNGAVRSPDGGPGSDDRSRAGREE